MWHQRTWSQNSRPLVTCPPYDPRSLLWASPSGMVILSPPSLGRVCWSTSLSPQRFDFDSFPSKTTKVCALPPIFEILPVKSLKARNQTLAPPFPELRYLSLAYNKVTLGFSTSFPRSRWEGGVWIALAWKPTLPFPASAERRFRNSQGGGSQGETEGKQAEKGVIRFSHRYWFTTHHVPGSVLGTGDTIARRDLTSALTELVTYREDRANKWSQYKHAQCCEDIHSAMNYVKVRSHLIFGTKEGTLWEWCLSWDGNQGA